MLKNTNMIEEAKTSKKVHPPMLEVIIFWLINIVIEFVQGFFLFPILFYHAISDSKINDILNQSQPDLEALTKRLAEVYSQMSDGLFVALLFLTGIGAAVVFVYCKFIEKRPVSSLGIRRGKISEFITPFVFGLFTVSAASVMLYLTKAASFDGINKFSVSTILLLAGGYVVMAFSTEILIHGYFMTSLSKKTNVYFALILSSLIYAMIQSAALFDALYFINQFLFAFLTGLLVLKRGNIWAAFSLHAAWFIAQGPIFAMDPLSNNGAGVLTVFKTTLHSGYDTLSGGVYCLNGSLFTTLVLFLSLGLVWNMKQNPDEIAEELVSNKSEELSNEE